MLYKSHWCFGCVVMLCGSYMLVSIYRSRASSQSIIYKDTSTKTVRTCKDGYFANRKRQHKAVTNYNYTYLQTNLTGKSFHNAPWDDLNRLHLLPVRAFHDVTMQTAEDVVFVTGSSSNHFLENIGAVNSAQKLKPSWTIIYYDLGLTYPQVDQVKSWCGVEYRRFDFSKYPPHFMNLKNFAWKIQIIAEVLKTQNGLLWFDASIRWHDTELSDVFQFTVDNGGFTMLSHTGSSVYSVTHPMMYSYLPTSTHELIHSDIYQGGALLIYHTEEVFYDVLWPLYLCSLQRWCITPNRDLYCNYDKLKKKNVYADCHRSDMSAMNILLLNKWNFETECYGIGRQLMEVVRGSHSEGVSIKSC